MICGIVCQKIIRSNDLIEIKKVLIEHIITTNSAFICQHLKSSITEDVCILVNNQDILKIFAVTMYYINLA